MKTLLTLLLLAPTLAQAGDKVLNGGDACEQRFLEIRDDLTSWIEKGGAEQLKFENGVTSKTYRLAMLNALKNAEVSCTETKLRVGSSEKVCVNTINEKGVMRIRCQRLPYLRLNIDEQYRLTHHEYAGLAGLEANERDESNYKFSDQLNGFLDEKVTKKLAVKGTLDTEALLDRSYQDFYGQYDVQACTHSGNIVRQPDEQVGPDLCNVAKVKLARSRGSQQEPVVLLAFEALKKPMFGFGTIFAYGKCQLGYGTSYCTPNHWGPKEHYISTRIENVGPNTYLDFTDAYNDGTFEKWSLVLKRLN